MQLSSIYEIVYHIDYMKNHLTVYNYNWNIPSSFIFVLLFVVPPAVASALPKEFQSVYMFSLFGGYAMIYIYSFIKGKQIKLYKGPFFLALLFFIFGCVNLIAHKNFNFFPIIAPFIGYIGYHYFCIHKVNTRLFDITFIILYIFYYVVYFSVIPNLWFRPGFDEDKVVFDIASSNAIPIALNNILFAYIILNKVLTQKKESSILFFSVINLSLCIIQQSRAGILVALIIAIIALFQFSRRSLIIVFIVGTIIIISNISVILNFLELIGNVQDLETIGKDPRAEAQSQFFLNMDTFTFFFGHTNKDYTDQGFEYTYNVFLDIWDRYGFSMLFILVSILFYRFIHYKKYSIPVLYFLPFIVYAMVESLYLPNYWDSIFYIVMFFKKEYHEVKM